MFTLLNLEAKETFYHISYVNKVGVRDGVGVGVAQKQQVVEVGFLRNYPLPFLDKLYTLHHFLFRGQLLLL